MQCTIDVSYVCWRQQILANKRNVPNSPNIIALQNLLIYSIWEISKPSKTEKVRSFIGVENLVHSSHVATALLKTKLTALTELSAVTAAFVSVTYLHPSHDSFTEQRRWTLQLAPGWE